MKTNPSIVSVSGVAIDTLNYERTHQDVKIEIDYINNLGVDIIVLDRRGFQYKIPSRFNPSKKALDFKIRELVHMVEGVSISFSEQEKDDDVSKLQSLFLDSLQMDSRAQRQTRKMLVETSIKLTDLRDSNNCLYVKEYDIVIYIPKAGYTVVHPTTVSRVINGLEINKTKINDFEFNIRINDPNRKIGDRFINISGLIYRIIPTRDETKPEGVVVTTTANTLDGEFVHVPMSLEEFEKQIKTYKSYEDAETLGNLETIMKNSVSRELEDLKHSNNIETEKLRGINLDKQRELDDAKNQLTAAQAELKRQETQHKKQLDMLGSEIDREKHAMEFQSLQRKSYYEERSYDRKDTSELIKFLPMIIGAGLVLLFK